MKSLIYFILFVMACAVIARYGGIALKHPASAVATLIVAIIVVACFGFRSLAKGHKAY